MPQHGWTKEAIEKGIEEMKLPKISAGIISNGPIDLVHHHYEKSNSLLGMIIIFFFYSAVQNKQAGREYFQNSQASRPEQMSMVESSYQ